MKQNSTILLFQSVMLSVRIIVCNSSKVAVRFFLSCIRLAELVELAELNQNQSSMTEGFWKLFSVSHSQLALWCYGYDS